MFNLCSSTWPKSQLRADWAKFGPVHVLDPFGVTGLAPIGSSGAAFNPLAAEDREARQYVPREDRAPRGEGRGDFRRDARPARRDEPRRDERPRDRAERTERPVKVHRDAVRPAGGKRPEGQGQVQGQQRRKPRKKANGGGRNWG